MEKNNKLESKSKPETVNKNKLQGSRLMKQLGKVVLAGAIVSGGVIASGCNFLGRLQESITASSSANLNPCTIGIIEGPYKGLDQSINPEKISTSQLKSYVESTNQAIQIINEKTKKNGDTINFQNLSFNLKDQISDGNLNIDYLLGHTGYYFKDKINQKNKTANPVGVGTLACISGDGTIYKTFAGEILIPSNKKLASNLPQ